VITSERRDKVHKLKYEKFHLNMRKICGFAVRVKYWNRLLRGTVESPSLEILKPLTMSWVTYSTRLCLEQDFGLGDL